jgi:hypothetical protein
MSVEDTKEELKLVSSLKDILSNMMSEKIDGAKEANALQSDLLKLLETEKNISKELIGDLDTYVDLVSDIVKKQGYGSDALQDQLTAIKKITDAEKARTIANDIIGDTLNNQVDSLESKIRSFPILGDAIADSLNFDKIKESAAGMVSNFTNGFTEAAASGQSFGGAMKSALGGVSKGLSLTTIKQSIFNAVAMINPYVAIAAAIIAIIALLSKMVSIGLKFNEGQTKLAKDLGISVDEARSMEESFNQISGSSKNLAVNTKSLVEAQTQLSAATGMTAQFSEQMLTDQINLTKYMGLSGDEAANFQKIAMSNGQTAREMQGEIAGSVEQFNNATGASVSLKDVVQDIAKLPADIRVGFKGTTGELAKTVAMAKVMGTTLEKSSAAADKSLDIESSLKAEAKARMLTGININNNEIRAAQLAGDGAKVLELQKRELEKISNFNDMAPYQQKAIADAMGMTVEEVVAQKDAMEMAKRAGIDLSTATLDQLKNAQGLSKEEREKLIKQKEQMSAQEKLSAMQEKLGDLINSIVAGPLGEFVGVLVDSLLPAFEAVQTVLSPIFKILGYILKGVFGIINPIIKLGAFILDLLFTPFESIFGIIDGVIMLFTDFDKGIAMIGNSLIDYLLYPLEMAAKLADGIVICIYIRICRFRC